MDQMLFSSFLTPAHYREWNMPGDFQIKTLIHTAAESVLRYVLSHTTSGLDSKPLLEFSLDKANFSQPFSAFFRETHSFPRDKAPGTGWSNTQRRQAHSPAAPPACAPPPRALLRPPPQPLALPLLSASGKGRAPVSVCLSLQGQQGKDHTGI